MQLAVCICPNYSYNFLYRGEPGVVNNTFLWYYFYMAEYKPPCHFGQCPNQEDVGESGQRICDAIARCMIDAGGAGVLEMDMCPTSAVFILGPEQEDSHMAEVRARLGIVGYFEDGGELFD